MRERERRSQRVEGRVNEKGDVGYLTLQSSASNMSIVPQTEPLRRVVALLDSYTDMF